MARFFGTLGFSEGTVETSPGIWEDGFVERPYYGDIQRQSRSINAPDKVNDDLTISNTISIVADEYAYSHFFCLKYVEWQGIKWTASSVEVNHPRLVISLGAPYHA